MIPTILLVEDDENDIYLVQHAFSKKGVAVNLQSALDGRAALEYLMGEGNYADRERHPFPCLMLLDLNIPYVHGLDVLKAVRENTEWHRLPVVILTSSLAESDLEQAYDRGANSYLVKPGTLEEVLELAELVGRYWLAKNKVCGALTSRCCV